MIIGTLIDRQPKIHSPGQSAKIQSAKQSRVREPITAMGDREAPVRQGNEYTLEPLRETSAAESHQLEAARHDLTQFAPIYERYFTRIFGYCLRRVSDPQEAEDLTSLIFTRAMTGLDSYRGGLVAAWLFRIAHNAVVNHLKARQTRTHVSLEDDEKQLMDRLSREVPELIDDLINAENIAVVRQLVAALPEAQQDILLMKVVGGLTADEIGAMIGKSAGAVRVTIHRILRDLYTQYMKTHHDAEGGLLYG